MTGSEGVLHSTGVGVHDPHPLRLSGRVSVHFGEPVRETPSRHWSCQDVKSAPCVPKVHMEQ